MILHFDKLSVLSLSKEAALLTPIYKSGFAFDLSSGRGCAAERIKRRKRLIEKWNRVTGYILLIIGVVTAWSSVHLSMGKWKHPGPGFFPFGLAIALILLSLALIFKNRKKDKIPAPFWPERTWLRPLLGVAILVFYALVVEWVGFVITTFIFLVAWMWVIERLHWLTIISISVGTTVGLYLIFSLLLEVPLPLGFLQW